VRLLCVPHAGGGPGTYASWVGALPWAEIAVVHLPGSGSRLREPHCRSIDDAADSVVEALCALDGRPVVAFGHSMGALMAFEVARRLEAVGRPITALTIAARRAPFLPERLEPVAHLPLQAFVARMQQRHGGIASQVLADPELLALFAPILQAHVAMVEAYEYAAAPPLRSPIVAYGGGADRHVPRADLELWGRETTGPHGVRILPGGHFFVHTARARLLAFLKHDIAHVFRRAAGQEILNA
jgi:surfactin synthase thioesterase subunit